MNGRSGVVTFFLFVFLGILICLQFLGMVQSDRLYDRLNDVVKVVESRGWSTARKMPDEMSSSREGGDWFVWGIGFLYDRAGFSFFCNVRICF